MRQPVKTQNPFHSDRGSQYASKRLHEPAQGAPDRNQHVAQGPWDNAACESFMKTLKHEEVFRNEYRNLAEILASIRVFIEKVYNQKRLHSALGYLPPAESEANLVRTPFAIRPVSSSG